MTKTKLAFVRCRLSCFSRRPVRFFPRLFPFACLLLFACRRFRCPALGLAGFFPRRIFRYRLSVFFYRLFLPAVRFVSFRLFPFAGPLLFACRRFRCPAIGTCRLFPAADFSPAAYCLFLPVVRFAFFRLFPFAGISLPCLPFPSSLFVSDLSFLFFSSLFSPFCFFVFTGKRQAAVRPADMAAVWR